VHRGRRNRAKERAMGWIATKACNRLAWECIIVKYYYLCSIIRMRLAEVAEFEWVGGGFAVW